MKMPSDNPREDSGAHRLAALLRKDAIESVNEERDQAAWRDLLCRVHDEDAQSVRGSRFKRWMLAPLAVGLGLVVLLSLRAFSPPSLRLTVDGRAWGRPDVAAEVERSRSLEFSDGSRLLLGSSGRLRVIRTDAHGALLLLERGKVDAAIQHRPSSGWRLELGPYVIQVIGTRFSATWNPDTGDMGVDLTEGAVAVAGPGISSPITVQSGQRFRANQVGNYNVQSRPTAEPAAPVAGPLVPAAAAPAKPRQALAEIPRASPPHERPTCVWTGLVSRGQFADVVAAAQAVGLETALALCPVPSLFALADAARYQAKFDLSKDALLSVRKRAPEQAGKAAFFLGRLDEARGNFASALAWYTHAMESNRGTSFQQEAKAGRARMAKMLQTQDTQPSAP
jgi:hypothetical protein